MRHPPTWLRVFFGIFPFVSLFFFPWTLTLITAFAAGLVFPPLAAIVGVLIDVLYHPGSGWPLGTLSGIALALLAYGVRHFVRTRVM